MTNALSPFAAAGLPNPAQLASALRKIDVSVAGDVALIKMDKTGHWVFGPDALECEADADWVVDPTSFMHGYIAWGDGSPLAEAMAPITAPLPDLDPAPQGATRGWEKQFAVGMKCLTGSDEGTLVLYKATSTGGVKAVHRLAQEVAAQIQLCEAEGFELAPCPIVRLGVESYAHKKYGKIFTPIFDVQEWATLADLRGDEDNAPAPAPEPEPEAHDEPPMRQARPARSVAPAPAATAPTRRAPRVAR